MSTSNDRPRDSIFRYVERNGRVLRNFLGLGVDGTVYDTTSGTAIKGYRFRENFIRERDVYLRLFERGVHFAGPFHIPDLVNYDDELEVVEMSIVSPPFLLDFAGAYLDRKPPYSDEQWDEWHAEKEEQFGAARWAVVDEAMSTLKRHGIHLADVHPGNVRFDDADE